MIIYVYVKDHMSALQIKNTCESDPRSYEVTLLQLVEHRTSIAEVMGLNPVGASELFLG